MGIKQLLLFALVALLVSCGSGSWPSEKQDEFLDECAAEGGGRSYCRCYLDQVMEKYPNADDAAKMDFETAVELADKCE